MYSLIMMAALTANGPEATAFCHKCHATVSYSCNGCSGCYGCGGCYGSCMGGYGGDWSGGGLYGQYGCYGVVSYGVYGGMGTLRYIDNNSCFGQYGGTACYGGCYGSCMGCQSHVAGCYGGCYGTPIWYGYGTVFTPAPPYNESGNPMVAPPPAAAPIKDPKAETKPMGGAARLYIDAPTDAVVTVDGMPVKAGADKPMNTPRLQPGQAYYYMVRVESTKDGKPAVESRRVIVRADEVVRESFGDRATAVVKQ